MKKSDVVYVGEEEQDGIICWALFCGGEQLTPFQPYDIKQLSLVAKTSENYRKSNSNFSRDWMGAQRF